MRTSATNEGQQTALRRRERQRELDDQAAFRFLLSDRRGRRAFNLIVHHHLNLSNVCSDVSAQSHRFEGKRIAANDIQAFAREVAPDLWLLAEAERVAAIREELVIQGAIRADTEEQETEDA